MGKRGLERGSRRGVPALAAMLLALMVPTGALAAPGNGRLHQVRAALELAPGTDDMLSLGSGYDSSGGSARARALQHRLALAGYATGPIDGLYGPLTEHAVRRFQAASGLQVDGVAGPRTLTALTAPTLVLYPGAGYGPGGSELVRSLQRRLAHAGYAAGPIDGRYGPLTEQEVRRFQAAHGLQVDGIAGPRTRGRLAYPARSQPRLHRQPTRRPASTNVRRASRPIGSGPATWVVLLLCAVGLGLLITAAFDTRRRRGDRLGPSRQTPSNAHGPNGRGDQRGDAEAAFKLGVLLEAQGELAGAEAAYRRADQRGHPAAASNLGALLEEQRELAGAEAAYRRADQRGDAVGAFNLGVLLGEQGDATGAEAAYRRADQRGYTAAASNLGVLLEEQGKLIGATAAYGRADQNGDATAAFNLGRLLEQQGELAGAVTAYSRADQRGDGELAKMARAALHDIRGEIRQPSASLNGGGHGGE